MDSQNQAVAPDSEVFGDKTTSVVNDAKQKDVHENHAKRNLNDQNAGDTVNKKEKMSDNYRCDCQIDYEQHLKALQV